MYIFNDEIILIKTITPSVESPKTDTPRSGQPPTTDNPVALIVFAKHVILKQLRIPNSEQRQGAGTEWRVLIQNYLPRTDNQKLDPIIFIDITIFP